jgi:hypothetical protein
MVSVVFAAMMAALLGIAFCFVGYRIFLVMLPIWGFFAGFWLGAQAVSLILDTGFLVSVTAWVAGFVLGLIGAVLSYAFYMVGVALVAGSIGASLGVGLMGAIGMWPSLLGSLFGAVTAGVAVGLTLWYGIQKYVIIAVTAVAGADLMVLSLLLILGRVSPNDLPQSGNPVQPILQDSWLWAIAWLIVTVAGVVVQARAHRDYEFTPDRYVEAWG